ncbi:MAG: hypothetical protein C4295_08790 [Candidatus Fervidibacterota bacterium]
MAGEFVLKPNQKVVLKRQTGAEYEFLVKAVSPEEVLLAPTDAWLDLPRLWIPGEIVTGIVQHDPPYQFQAVVIRARRIPLPMLLLSAPQQVTIVERRRYFRVRVLFSAKIAFLFGEEETPSQFYPATGLDISSMGVGLFLKRPFPPQCPLPFALCPSQRLWVLGTLPPVHPEFPTELSFEAKGEIQNVTEMEAGWRIGVQFTAIDRRTQDLIVAWSFAFQRRLLREGLPILEGEATLDEFAEKEAWQR